MAEQTERAESVAILSTGDEVVEGRTVDTNASYIADRVAQLGCDVVCKIVVGDFPDRLAVVEVAHGARAGVDAGEPVAARDVGEDLRHQRAPIERDLEEELQPGDRRVQRHR